MQKLKQYIFRLQYAGNHAHGNYEIVKAPNIHVEEKAYREYAIIRPSFPHGRAISAMAA